MRRNEKRKEKEKETGRRETERESERKGKENRNNSTVSPFFTLPLTLCRCKSVTPSLSKYNSGCNWWFRHWFTNTAETHGPPPIGRSWYCCEGTYSL